MSGIDYGLGQTNIDSETGIRYGVIPACAVECWDGEAEPDYGEPTCPRCGHPIEDDGSCAGCGEYCEEENYYPDFPLGWTYQKDDLEAEQEYDSSDIFVIKSPYYTRAQFCSPCAPGACYLPKSEPSCKDGAKAYCFDHKWFKNGKAPYPVYRVNDNTLIEPPKEEEN